MVLKKKKRKRTEAAPQADANNNITHLCDTKLNYHYYVFYGPFNDFIIIIVCIPVIQNCVEKYYYYYEVVTASDKRQKDLTVYRND